MNWQHVWQIIERHRIVYGIVAALIVAVFLTLISMALYISSGASRLDLSRPGYEKIRTEVRDNYDEKSFSSTGPINSEVINDFQERFTRHRDALKKLDTFDTNALDDTQLQIAPKNAQ